MKDAGYIIKTPASADYESGTRQEPLLRMMRLRQYLSWPMQVLHLVQFQFELRLDTRSKYNIRS